MSTTTETLSFDDAVAWAYDHTGHFTSDPSKNTLLRLASAVTPQLRCLQWLSPHNEDITVTHNSTTELYTCEATPRAEPVITDGLMRVREHHGYGHGLRPGEDRDINCPNCRREDEHKPAGTTLLRELRHARGIDG